MVLISDTDAWKAVAAAAEVQKGVHLREALDDAARNAALRLSAEGVVLDYAREKVDAATRAAASRRPPRTSTRPITPRWGRDGRAVVGPRLGAPLGGSVRAAVVGAAVVVGRRVGASVVGAGPARRRLSRAG